MKHKEKEDEKMVGGQLPVEVKQRKSEAPQQTKTNTSIKEEEKGNKREIIWKRECKEKDTCYKA